MLSEKSTGERSGISPRRTLIPLALTQFIASFAGSNMNVAITNPLHRPVRKALLAADLLLGRDMFGGAWIADHRAESAGATGG